MRITVDHEACSLCGLCVRECSVGVWRMKDGRPEPEAPELCNLCSHCIAVCPCDAVRHEGLDASQTVKANRELDPAMYRDIVLGRRSVRQYKDKPVPREIIEQVLDLARYAPTASNEQDVGYVVVTDRELIRSAAGQVFGFAQGLHARLSRGVPGRIMKAAGLDQNRYIRIMDRIKEQAPTGRDFILHNAPVLILIHGPARSRFACDNCAIAATTIINYAHSLGLGTCFIGFLTVALRLSGTMRKELGVPGGRRAYSCLVMGYPDVAYTRTVSRQRPDVIWR